MTFKEYLTEKTGSLRDFRLLLQGKKFIYNVEPNGDNELLIKSDTKYLSDFIKQTLHILKNYNFKKEIGDFGEADVYSNTNFSIIFKDFNNNISASIMSKI